MPVYNTERFLDEAIRSVRSQTFANFELLVMDDGSTDRSITIAQRHASEDPRIRVVRLAHRGYTEAIIEGIRLARASWIARLDADDVSAPHRLSRQWAVLNSNTAIAAVGAHAWMIGETGRVVGLQRPGPTSPMEFEVARARGPIYLIHSSVMFSKNVALAVGGYRSEYEPAEDLDLWNRIADEHSVVVVPEPLVSYRIHASATSTERFQEQLRSARRVTANIERRRSGLSELSAAEFESLERQLPLNRRLQMELAARSQLYYRLGGAQLAANRPIGVLWLALAVALYPSLPIRRLKNQGVVDRLLHRRPRPSAMRFDGPSQS